MRYGCENVICPFYKDETKNAIRCEGIFSEAISNNFETTKAKANYRQKFCCSKFKECSLSLLLESKYR